MLNPPQYGLPLHPAAAASIHGQARQWRYLLEFP